MNEAMNHSGRAEVKEKIENLKKLMATTKGSGYLGEYIAYFEETYISPICTRDAWLKYDSEDVKFLGNLMEDLQAGPIGTVAGGIVALGNLIVSGNAEGDGTMEKDCTGRLGWLVSSLGGALEELTYIQNQISFSLAQRLTEELKRQEGGSQ